MQNIEPTTFNRLEALGDSLPKTILVTGKKAQQCLLLTFTDYEVSDLAGLELPSGSEGKNI